ncbi:uncharacterized protein LOC117647001 isoform X2 [Thrips palmi]|uniref:Uncharacterized protein LOC117647001 isoform X2 n=1 Tax=Thrips palmi TaxID=161013 RepID=A0A6P8ZAU4_THRPL|nr:uncharacterized protein LOC117647001 isoform X2 [Thrips palmi]XP_034244363.1 uncharacterized protein LOC117647001 isoform X2 [Thrips palmi]XP_034244364.1 uncharacterized protein LOC117647001 isoform X2 [Thrips palmi]XP_034244366.1 uncharacterized protein LOC117647001 isoform X2 [Thrips palmi]XP_034244367.1 uncharacterized protein LOC117647001 isoform X2 [Thrips palmi]
MSPVAVFTLATLWLFGKVESKRLNTFAGPFIAYGHSFSPCESDGGAVIHIRATHFNPLRPYDLQLLTGNFTIKENIGDDSWSLVDMAVRSNNEWKENAFVFNFPKMGCSGMREQFPNFYRIISKHTGAPMDRAVPCVMSYPRDTTTSRTNQSAGHSRTSQSYRMDATDSE